MSEPTDPVERVMQSLRGMSDDDWKRLLRRLKEIDPDFFEAPTNPVTGEKIVPKHAVGARPPRHESGSLA
jgi:hypothetical protein